MDLFGDLPEPTQTSSARPTVGPDDCTEPSRSASYQDGGQKRKGDPGAEAEVKRVCTEEVPAMVPAVVPALVPAVPRLRGYVSARRGERDEMQDAHVLLPDMTSLLKVKPKAVSRLSYFAVFDGHGGARASRFTAEHLHHTLAKNFPTGESPNLDKLIKKCLLDTFRQTDEDFLKKASSQKPAWKDGSTATCALVVDDTVYVANLGDSRAVLCRMETTRGQQKPVTLALSKEHNPTLYDERMRIQRAGGTVRDGRVLGVLEVSRSIGDGQYKRCGVISTPDLRRCQLTPDDRFLILACDGLFKVFSADEAVRFVLDALQDGAESEQMEAACQQLASESVRRGCADNVTVILLSISF